MNEMNKMHYVDLGGRSTESDHKTINEASNEEHGWVHGESYQQESETVRDRH